MYATRLFQLLLITLAIICVVHASSNDGPRHAEAVMARQNDDDNDDTTEAAPSSTPTDDDDDEPSSTGAPPSSTPEEESTTEEQPESTTAPPPQQTSSDPVESTTSEEEEQSTTQAAPSSTSEQAAPSTTTPEESSQVTSAPETSSTSSEEEEEEETTESQFTSTSFMTITTTNEGGATEVFTSAAETITGDVDLNGGDDSDSNGLSEENRNIVIGVVVGVGGAIILGALGVVAWRIRARKKLAEENAGLMDYDEAGKSEPGTTGSPPQSQATTTTRSPFQSTLDNYHQPTTVNASSNF